MKRALLLAIALALGVGAGECLTTNFAFRASLGRIVRRGELNALVGRNGIYDRDVERAGQPLAQLIDQTKLTIAAADQPIGSGAIDHQMDLLRWQFGDERSWNFSLAKAATTTGALRRAVAANLRDRSWLEAQLVPKISPNESELQQFFDAHAERFRLPLRFRASHLFLAAPDGYPNDVIEAKRALINELAMRLRNGESFPTLVAEFSEDEATKRQGGDLNYFAEERILPELFSAAEALHEGETSAPIRSRLGFHLLRLTQKLPAEQLSFVAATPEIVTALENQKRPAAIAEAIARLNGKIEIATRRN